MRRRVKRSVFLLLVLAASALFFAKQGTAVAGEGGPTQAGVVEHEVIEGDNLSLLAGYYYKDPRQWRKIYSLNGGLIREPGTLLPGTVLKIRTEAGQQWQITYAEFRALVFR